MDDDSRDAKRKRLSTEPWCWVEKQKLRMIADIFSQSAIGISTNAARSIYLAVTEIVSDRESNVFDASHEEIAHRAGVSPSTAKRILPIFRKIGLLKIKRNWINGLETRSTYTLIRGALAHHEPPLGQTPKIKRATDEERTKKASKVTARIGNTICSNTRGTSLADEGSRFNPKTGEYEW